MDQDNMDMLKAEKHKMEKEVSQKINWVKPEERYVNNGEFIGPNTYRSCKMGTDFEEAYRESRQDRFD